jgi:ABC-type branched-subunit amino acid transport system ATPase component
MSAVASERATRLAVDGVSKSFGGTAAVQSADLELRRGRVVGLIGPNGSGKTTLLNIVSGVVSSDSGTVSLGERDITRWSLERRARAGIARTFQNLRLFHRQTALENVAAAVATRRNGRNKGIHDEARSILCDVGLEDAASDHAPSLTYGDQRRLELARALACLPSFLLLDEPTAGMGEQESEALGSAIAAAVESLDCGVLCIAHDLRFVSQVCEWVYVLQEGRLIASGTPAEIRSNPLVVDAYLGRFADEISVLEEGGLE